MFNTRVTLDQAIWLTLFAVICVIILLQVDNMIDQMKKSRVIVFHTDSNNPNVIEGDFKEIEFPNKEARKVMTNGENEP